MYLEGIGQGDVLRCVRSHLGADELQIYHISWVVPEYRLVEADASKDSSNVS